MKMNHYMRRGFTLVELLVVIAIIATLAGVGVPALLSKKKDGDRAATLMNAKQVGVALFAFAEDNSRFPDSETLNDLPDGVTVRSGSSTSNDFLSQLIAGGYVDQESIFYAKASFTQKPDEIRNTSSNLLEAGECGFGYFMVQGDGGQRGLSSSYNSGIPVLVAAQDESQTSAVFDVDVYNRKAVVLKIDQSASVLNLDTDGKAILAKNDNSTIYIDDQGDGTVWGNKQPVYVPPATN